METKAVFGQGVFERGLCALAFSQVKNVSLLCLIILIVNLILIKGGIFCYNSENNELLQSLPPRDV